MDVPNNNDLSLHQKEKNKQILRNTIIMEWETSISLEVGLFLGDMAATDDV